MPDLPASLAAVLAARYTIERVLHRGTCAVIYLALDRKFGRPVALKVLLCELASMTQRRRFLREIKIAAQLRHPLIVPLYDSGTVEGFSYYVMPYIDGPSLRERLGVEPRLQIVEILQIASGVAAVLDFAHQRGVVHRDIKPDNILLFGGEPLVMDFGIARAISIAGGTGVTKAGTAVGTPAYMSPEQARGHPDIDGRSDIYNLGCVVYEMLAGHTPFMAATPQEMLARQAFDPVPPLRAARLDVPEMFERAVLKALAKSPAERFASATQFVRALTGEPATTAPVQRSDAGGILLRALRLPLAWMRGSKSDY